MYEEFVEPSKLRADAIVHSLGNATIEGGASSWGDDGSGDSTVPPAPPSSTSVALRMIVNHLRLEAGIEAGDVDCDSATAPTEDDYPKTGDSGAVDQGGKDEF
eukprot:CAMPEP_0178484090 /NCGR_PEP_ID=MMETSP0696-20121128/7570_1 /TAXON_ID=265572 /ORGANISM="Extubocellulus spinifer, Strain CCMP396" /LENGTH=102 /DNA_ID=CAMNT_0020111627 /DNA_START=227 /DNA_END=535 /DNA_ORIENTATION=+